MSIPFVGSHYTICINCGIYNEKKKISCVSTTYPFAIPLLGFGFRSQLLDFPILELDLNEQNCRRDNCAYHGRDDRSKSSYLQVLSDTHVTHRLVQEAYGFIFQLFSFLGLSHYSRCYLCVPLAIKSSVSVKNCSKVRSSS